MRNLKKFLPTLLRALVVAFVVYLLWIILYPAHYRVVREPYFYLSLSAFLGAEMAACTCLILSALRRRRDDTTGGKADDPPRSKPEDTPEP